MINEQKLDRLVALRLAQRDCNTKIDALESDIKMKRHLIEMNRGFAKQHQEQIDELLEKQGPYE